MYTVGGLLEDGRLSVDSEDYAIVILVLNGVDMSSSTNAPVAILNAAKTVPMWVPLCALDSRTYPAN